MLAKRLTAVELKFLLDCYTDGLSLVVHHPNVQRLIPILIKEKIICAGNTDYFYEMLERGDIWVKAILAVPPPVEKWGYKCTKET